MLAPKASEAVARGKYYWELVFSFDNSGNTLPISRKETITRKRTVNSKEFLSTKFTINTGFSFKDQNSVSLKFAGVGGNNTTEYTFHIDLANELVKTLETNTTVNEESVTESEYQVGPRSKLELYRLCYFTDGAAVKTDIVATTPRPDIFVDLNFECVQRLLGLRGILDILGSTRPESQNKEEWERIRNAVAENSDKPQEQAFRVEPVS